MFKLLRKLLLFRVGQKASKRFAHRIGFRMLVPFIGILGGMKMMRRHS